MTLRLPESLAILAVPQSQSLTAEGYTLTTVFEEVDPRTIRRATTLVVDLPEPVCSADYFARVRPDLASMIASLRAQLIYR